MKRVRILLRVSSRQQLEADGDLSLQRQLVEDYVAGHNDWLLDGKEYFEGSQSGYKTALSKRDVLQEALEDGQKGEYDVLAAYKDDRIGRRMWEIGAYVMALKSCGVDIYTVKDGCISPESSDIMGQIMLALRYGNAQKSSSDTGMRVKDTAGKMVRQGKFMGGRAPYGYQLVPSGELSRHGRILHRLEILPEQAEVVRRIYKLSLYRELGSVRIARILNEDPCCQSMAPSEQWKSGTVTGILSNPVYTGYMAYRRREQRNGKCCRQNSSEWILAEQPDENLRIIEQNLWDQTQEKRKQRAEKYHSPKVPRSCGPKKPKLHSEQHNQPSPIKRNDCLLPLIDVIFCSACGRKMIRGTRYSYWTVKSTGEKRSCKRPLYLCPAARAGLPHQHTTQFRADKIEMILSDILGRLIDTLLPKEIIRSVLDQNLRQEKRIETLALAKLEKELHKTIRDLEILESRLPEAMSGDYPIPLTEVAGLIKKNREKISDQQQLICEKQEYLKQLQFPKGNLSSQNPAEQNSSDKKETTQNAAPLTWGEIFKKSDRTARRVITNLLVHRIDVTDGLITVRFNIAPPAPPVLPAQIICEE